MKQEELTALAVRRMKEVFPKEDWHESTYFRKEGEVRCQGDKDYFYFSAPLYFSDGFVDASMISRLQAGARLLSVGVGEGHLERLLHLGFEIPQENIVIADYPGIHPRIKAKGFQECIFDMTKKWPDFKQRFDCVLFPESLNIATLNYGKEMCDRFYEDIKRVTKLCDEGRLDELRDPEVDFFLGLMGQDVPVVKTRYDIVRKALANLNPRGEVRISSGIKPPQQPAYIKLKLKKDGFKVSYHAVKYQNYMFIKLEE